MGRDILLEQMNELRKDSFVNVSNIPVDYQFIPNYGGVVSIQQNNNEQKTKIIESTELTELKPLKDDLKIDIPRMKLGKKIDEGGFGVVDEVLDDSVTIAYKVIQVGHNGAKDKDEKNFFREKILNLSNDLKQKEVEKNEETRKRLQKELEIKQKEEINQKEMDLQQKEKEKK